MSNHNEDPNNSSSIKKVSDAQKRNPAHRVFVNRSLQLSKIKFFGFDMDYTLALYKSPQYEILGFNLVIDELIQLGYPKEIKDFVYDPNFPVRGLWYDKLYGNLLKVDTHGNILVCVHGFKFLKTTEIYKFYPNKFINFDDSRVYMLNTLFNLPEIYILACLVNFFTTSNDFKNHDTGVSSGDVFVSFKAIFQDVRQAMDHVHNKGKLKDITVKNIEEYVVEDERLATLFDCMKENNKKVFLMTNSGYEYTNKIMEFLLKESKTGRNWRTYFDYIVVDARKPLFFEEGTSMKEIDVETGVTKFGSHSGPLRENKVYSGGNCDVFSKLIGSRGKDVLYVGDHIFGDIIKSKKERAWRTFLIVPELSQEMVIWHDKRDLFNELELLDKKLAETLINFDSSSRNVPNISNIKQQIQKCVHEMDMQYGLIGSIFRTGSRLTHFASQVTRFADIYAASHLNLLHYPFSYLFKSPPMLMPHESTVNPNEITNDGYNYMKKTSRTLSSNAVDGSTSFMLETNNYDSPKHEPSRLSSMATPETKLNPGLSRPQTPSVLNHDFDDESDEEETFTD